MPTQANEFMVVWLAAEWQFLCSGAPKHHTIACWISYRPNTTQGWLWSMWGVQPLLVGVAINSRGGERSTPVWPGLIIGVGEYDHRRKCTATPPSSPNHPDRDF